jgi:acyl-homoserine lactone acylase PvdQ
MGYLPYEELPYMFNPASGYIASANNRGDDGYPYWSARFLYQQRQDRGAD